MTIEIANRLCAYRKYHGLSQEELAERIGVSRQAVSKWERAEASPDTDNLILLAQVYGVTLDDLLNTDPVEEIPETEAEENAAERVSFKNGIHVHSKNGDQVDIDLRGVHVDTTGGEHVHIGFNGIHVEENGHVHVTTNENGEVVWENNDPAWHKRWNAFPWPVVCAVVYLLMGFLNVFGGWSLGWMIFLTIPLYYSLGDAIAKRNANHFAYPVLTVLLYLLLGFLEKLWHPGWIVFITIPLYYWICSFFKKK